MLWSACRSSAIATSISEGLLRAYRMLRLEAEQPSKQYWVIRSRVGFIAFHLSFLYCSWIRIVVAVK